MADDSIQIPEVPICDPCDTPRGMLYYDMKVLTDDQQIKLNDLKIQTVRDDEKYLASHPEVRAIVAIILRHMYRLMPKTNIHEHVASIFAQPRAILQKQIDKYVGERAGHVYEGNSSVGIVFGDEKTEQEKYLVDYIEITSVLDEALDKVDASETLECLSSDFKDTAKEIVRESLFDVFDKLDGSYTDLKQAALKEFLHQEIVNRINVFAQKVATNFGGVVPMGADEVVYEKLEVIPKDIADDPDKIEQFEKFLSVQDLDAYGERRYSREEGNLFGGLDIGETIKEETAEELEQDRAEEVKVTSESETVKSSEVTLKDSVIKPPEQPQSYNEPPEQPAVQQEDQEQKEQPAVEQVVEEQPAVEQVAQEPVTEESVV